MTPKPPHTPLRPGTDDIATRIRACRICADRFAATATHHEPAPVIQFAPTARLLIASQAPGIRAHESGLPFSDPSGVRLREWMDVDEATFYDADRVAIVPMAFCFPGYDAKGSDLPPPRICAATWRAAVLAALPDVQLTLLVGGHAMAWHLGGRARVNETMRTWRDAPAGVIPLPHPSWRNTAWLKRNPWFAADLLPVLRARVTEVLDV